MADATSSTATSTPAKSSSTATAPAEEKSNLELATEAEHARIKENQKRYDARVGGMSEEEYAAQAKAEAAKTAEAPAKQENGGQVTTEDEGSA